MSHPQTQPTPKPPTTPEDEEQAQQQAIEDGVNAIGTVLAMLGAKAGLPPGSRIVLEFPVPDESSAPAPPTTLEVLAAVKALTSASDDTESKAAKEKQKKDEEKAAKDEEKQTLDDITALLQSDDEKKKGAKNGKGTKADGEDEKTPEQKVAEAQQKVAQLQLVRSAQWSVYRGPGTDAPVGTGDTLAYALKVIDAVLVPENGALTLKSPDGTDLPKDETHAQRTVREAKEQAAKDAAEEQTKAADKAAKKSAA